jgi:hypothetical protein
VHPLPTQLLVGMDPGLAASYVARVLPKQLKPEPLPRVAATLVAVGGTGLWSLVFGTARNCLGLVCSGQQLQHGCSWWLAAGELATHHAHCNTQLQALDAAGWEGQVAAALRDALHAATAPPAPPVPAAPSATSSATAAKGHSGQQPAAADGTRATTNSEPPYHQAWLQLLQILAGMGPGTKASLRASRAAASTAPLQGTPRLALLRELAAVWCAHFCAQPHPGSVHLPAGWYCRRGHADDEEKQKGAPWRRLSSCCGCWACSRS